jgi:hypothetical protein
MVGLAVEPLRHRMKRDWGTVVMVDDIAPEVGHKIGAQSSACRIEGTVAVNSTGSRLRIVTAVVHSHRTELRCLCSSFH